MTNVDSGTVEANRRYIATQIPEEDRDNLDAVLDVVTRWRRGETSMSTSQRIHAAQGLGLIAAALAETVAEDQVVCTSSILEGVIGVIDTLRAVDALSSWYAEVCRTRGDLFRKPVRSRLTDREGIPDLHPDLVAQRRLATDAEVAQFGEEVAVVFDTLGRSVREADDLASLTTSHCLRFLAPTAPWRYPELPDPTALYFWYDAAGQLLYIGITGDLATRQARHAKRSSWAEFADHSTIRRFPTRMEAEEAEARLIRELGPLFNHTHNDTPEARARLVAYLIEHGRIHLLAPAISRG